MTDAGPTLPGSPKRGYEISRVSSRGLLIFLICFVITAGVLQLLLWLLMGRLYRSNERTAPAPWSAVAVTPHPQPPLQPSPGHNTTPPQDWQTMRDQDTRILSTYGWIDRRNQIARIPIDRAMDLLLQRGLPVATQPAPPEGRTR